MRTLALLSGSMLLLSLTACGESHDASDDGGGMVATDGGGMVATDGGGMVATDGGVIIVTSDGGAGGTDSGVVAMDGGGAPTDGGTVVVGPDGGSVGSISCGMARCNAATQQCCIGGGPAGATMMCIPIGDMCAGGTADCDGPEDCMGSEVCCGRGGVGGFSVSCTSAMMCGGGFTSLELCHTAGDCSDSTDMCCPVAAMGISGSFCAARCFGVAP